MLKSHGQDCCDHPLQPSAPFWEDPSEFEGLWQERWGWVPFWSGLSPSFMEAEELRPLPLCVVSPPPCRQHPHCFLPSLLAPGGIFLLCPAVLSSPLGLGFSRVPCRGHGPGTDLHELPGNIFGWSVLPGEEQVLSLLLSFPQTPCSLPGGAGLCHLQWALSSTGAVAMLWVRPWWSPPLATSSFWFFSGHPAGEVGKRGSLPTGNPKEKQNKHYFGQNILAEGQQWGLVETCFSGWWRGAPVITA